MISKQLFIKNDYNNYTNKIKSKLMRNVNE